MGNALYTIYDPYHNFSGRKVLNIGSGFAKFHAPNVTNVDAFESCNPEVVWDLNKTPYPFEDESFDLVIANHVMEHLTNWWGAFNECARVLKEGGELIIYVPGDGTEEQMGYRDHVVPINRCSFFGTYDLTRAGGNAFMKAQEAEKSPASRMRLYQGDQVVINKWWIRWMPRRVQYWMANHLRNVVSEMGYYFVKMKRGTQNGNGH